MSEEPQNNASFSFGSNTNIGRCRENNEDSHLCVTLGKGTAHEGCLLIVSDGVGGANAGEVASGMASEGLHRALSNRLAREAPPENRCPWIREAILDMDKRIREAASSPGQQGMGATVSLLWLEGAVGWWGQAGDSRIYLFRSGKLTQITRDHSPVGRLRAQGQLTEEAARNHPYRHLIDECLGGDGSGVHPDVETLHLERGDIFLLCSDGLSDGLWDKEIAEEMERAATGLTAQETALGLVNRANEASGRDNITAVVACVECLPAPKKSPASVGSWRFWFGKRQAS